MLIVTRKPEQSIMIGSDIRVVVVSLDGDRVKLGIEAPPDVEVRRFENREANDHRNPPNVASDPVR